MRLHLVRCAQHAPKAPGHISNAHEASAFQTMRGMHERNTKHQAPSSREAPNIKLQRPQPVSLLTEEKTCEGDAETLTVIEAWCFSGAWCFGKARCYKTDVRC